MKKTRTVILFLLLCVFFTGCAADVSSEPLAPSAMSEPEPALEPEREYGVKVMPNELAAIVEDVKSSECESVDLYKIAPDFAKRIESGNLDGVSVTIYYMHPMTLTTTAVTFDRLMSRQTGIIEVSSDQLKEHIDALKEMNVTLTPLSAEEKFLLDTRMGYVFEAEGEWILGVALEGVILDENSEVTGLCTSVNGLMVEKNDKLALELVKLFFDEAASEMWGPYLE